MAAQDAELQLKVSLDLAFFRQQLAGLGSAAAGTPLKLQVQFDRRSVQNELNALGVNIKKRDYRLSIQTNLDAEIKKARTLAEEFRNLEKGAFASPQPKQRGSFTKSAFRGMDLGDIRKLYEEAANAGLLSYDEAIAKNRKNIEAALYGLGKDSITGLLNGLKSDNEKLKVAAKALGKDLISSVKTVLGIASPSREFKKIGEDSGEGLELGLKSGIGEATRIGIKEMRDLFRALQSEAQSGAARLQATMLGAMAGIVQLPGGRQQRQRLQQTGGAINNVMTGGALRNIQTRQRGVRGQTEAASAATPAFLTALPLMFGMGQSELTSRLSGLYGQQYRAPRMGTGVPNQFAQIIQSLAASRSALSATGGVDSRLFTGGARNPGLSASGYIGRSALSAGYVNYPPGMPSAYATSFMGSTTGGYGMAPARRQGPTLPVRGIFSASSGSLGQFPASPMMGGGFGAGAGSFVPMEGGRSVNSFAESLSALTGRVKDAATAVKRQLFPTFGDLRAELIGINRSVSVASNAQGNRFYGNYMKKSGQIGMYDFPMSGMMGPSSPLGRITAQSSMFGGGGMQPPGGGGGGGGRFGGFGDAMGFGPTPSPIDLRLFQQARLPLTGAIAELTSEFANATKQVLLFGTAYKALAFFMNLPGEAFEAAKALATYKNQLQAVTSESNTFEQSFAFVDGLAQRFNVPLESARQGFVKLYASMEPAGFGQGQIENLFEGISKATAAFGLSADKVDRVNYAFAQMASKGQIMSEELKGQLGDVLPGALALFAEAAQMEIPEFGKAMEDGAFQGDAMRQVLDNVAVLMNTKFGPAAQNAAKTLQGALNQMQNNLKRMYESLSPFVDQFAAAFGPQVNSLINDVTSVIKALTGSFADNSDILSTLSPRAEALYNAFRLIGPSVVNAVKNVGSFISSLQILVGPLFAVTKGLLDFISLPVAARVGLYAVIIASLNGAFQLLARTGILQATVAMVRFLATLNIAQINVYIAGIRTVIAVLASMITTVNVATIAVLALKVAVGGIVVTAVLAGLDMLAQRLFNIGDAANKSKGSVRELMQELDRIAGSADVEAGTKAYLDANTKLAIARKANQKALEDLAKAQETGSGSGGLGLGVDAAKRRADQTYADLLQARREVNAARKARDIAVQRQEEERQRTQQQLKPIDLSAGEDKTKAAAAQSLESLESLRDQLAKARMEGDMERAKILFEYQKRLDERRFELQESGANDVQKAGIKLAKDLFDVRMRLEEQIFNAGQAITREAGSVAPGSRPPRAPKGQSPYATAASTQYGPGAHQNTMIGQTVGALPGERPVSGSERRDIVAAEKTVQTTKTETLRLTLALRNAEADYAQVIKQNFDTIFPVAQLQLQNQLLAARYQLELQGVPKEAIDAQMAIAEARAKGIEMQKKLDEELTIATAAVEKYNAIQQDGTQLTKEQTYELKNAEAFINAYSASAGKAAAQVKEFTIAQLESAIATMKQADALKALQETSERINQSVEGVTSTYKDMFKEIAKGGDSVDALKKAQEALADQALTMFFDFAMQPVEKFFKDQLGAIFGVPDEEAKRQEQLTAMEKQLAELKAARETQQKIDKNVEKIANGGEGAAQSAPASLPGVSSPLALPGATGGLSSFIAGQSGTAISYAGATPATGTGMGSIGSYDWSTATENLDAATKSVAETVNETAKKTDEANVNWQEALGKTVQGIGIAAGSIMGIMAGIKQIEEGGTSNVLGGIGSILLSVGGAIGGFASMFKPAAAANGAVWSGGFRAFANGGMVTGPTLGLIGEGRYNEAIVPLPDGKSIPVQMRGQQSSRDLLSNGATSQQSSPVLSMSFQTTKFGDREYVDVAQLQAAMAETRKMAARDGANRGASLALDKLQNSPSARRKVGMR